MSFVMRKSEASVSDRYYGAYFPAGALIVAPEEFFTRFGKTFSTPRKDMLIKDLDRNLVFHAMPSGSNEEGASTYIVRRIHNSRIKDALAGKLSKEILGEKHRLVGILDDEEKTSENQKTAVKKVAEKEQEPKAEPAKVNVFQLTLAQLRALATEHKIDTKKATREQLQRALQKVLGGAEN